MPAFLSACTCAWIAKRDSLSAAIHSSLPHILLSLQLRLCRAARDQLLPAAIPSSLTRGSRPKKKLREASRFRSPFCSETDSTGTRLPRAFSLHLSTVEFCNRGRALAVEDSSETRYERHNWPPRYHVQQVCTLSSQGATRAHKSVEGNECAACLPCASVVQLLFQSAVKRSFSR